MSRYELKTKPGNGVIKAVIGWDRPLQTFFAQVFTPTDEDPEEGEATIWLGTEPGELPNPEAAIRVVEAYAEVPETLAATLAADRLVTIGVQDGAHQVRAKLGLFAPRS
ncbi:hypothetical protein [Novosphingobium album (ex Liu et al. 2023)]|uniref:Uncharacterized protein n=1 Tax=Novosphingobium album (ex Liu et al. 2023) TaxID=3031130 RepID=A0ABT5WKL7_9SPHN|nr:hypothetical protein [Novosphingobium album (ex Liu et al. 2023)]MDE8650587.1 hypothetical protein [Novosphingobium album (ex Liu et al. 2023)]